MTAVSDTASFRRRLNPIGNKENQESFIQKRQQKEVQRCGWLTKQGGVIKSWQRRWFVLKNDQLLYFSNNDESSKQLGSIFLPGNKVVELPENPNEPDKFPFEIQSGTGRMTITHDSYPLCAASEDERKYWIQSIKKVMFGDKGGAIFGQTLVETMLYEARTSNRKVPCIVEMCVEFLLENSLETEGIFRLPGRSILIKQLKELFDSGESVNFVIPDVDIHSVASLLKLYLRELPEPIISRKFYEPVMKIVQRDMQLNPDKAMDNLKALLSHMPKHSYNLIQYLSHFLYKISQNSEVNKMTAMNLATVFVHSVIRPEDEDPALLMGTANGRTQVTFILITSWDRLFTMEYNAQGAAVKVDTILDLEGTGSYNKKDFNPNTCTPSLVPQSSSADDLLDLDLGPDVSDVALPTPILADPTNKDATDCTITETKISDSNCNTLFNKQENEKLDSKDHYANINDLDPYAATSCESDRNMVEQDSLKKEQPPVPSRRAPLPPAPNDQVEKEPPKVIMRTKSAPKVRPRKLSGTFIETNKVPDPSNDFKISSAGNLIDNGPPPRPPKPKSASFSSPGNRESKSNLAERPVPGRPAPKPPMKVSKSIDSISLEDLTSASDQNSSVKPKSLTGSSQSLDSNTTTDTRDSTTSSASNIDEGDDNDEDQMIDSLINTNTEHLSLTELQEYVTLLKKEFSNYVIKSNSFKLKASKSKEKHNKHLLDLAVKLDHERAATATAVDKIMELQNQLQAYNMKYGLSD